MLRTLRNHFLWLPPMVTPKPLLYRQPSANAWQIMYFPFDTGTVPSGLLKKKNPHHHSDPPKMAFSGP